MTAIRMMQGDARNVTFSLTLNNDTVLTPKMAPDVEVCIGNDDGPIIRKLLSDGSVGFDSSINQWFFRLSQKETLGLDPQSYNVVARPKFGVSADADVKGVSIGRIVIVDGMSKEVI